MNEALGYFILGIFVLIAIEIVIFIILTAAPIRIPRTGRAKGRATRTLSYLNPAILIPA